MRLFAAARTRLVAPPRTASRTPLHYLADDAPSWGFTDAGVRLVRALRRSGVPIEHQVWSDRAGTGPTIAHVKPEQLRALRREVGRSLLIAHTASETDRLPAHWPALFNAVDYVVVPTEWDRDVLLASGVTEPVVVVPHMVCDPVPGDGGVALKLPADVVAFYTIGRWDQSEAPELAIRAFLDAFTADDPVALVVKTTVRTHDAGAAGLERAPALVGMTMVEVARIVRDYPRPPMLRVEVEEWAPGRFAGLHSRGDCFVSLSPGDGWGIDALDAAAYGNPVVWVGGDGQLHRAVELLREVARDLGAAQSRAVPMQSKVLRECTSARVVRTLLDGVPELRPIARRTLAREAADPTEPSTAPKRRSRTPADDLLLVGLNVGPWKSAYDNWVEMADRHGYVYELLGGEVAEPYVRFATKWRVLLDYFSALARERLVFYLDTLDGFVCDCPAATLARYRSYDRRLVFSAEASPRPLEYDVPDAKWRGACAGGFVGEAGIIADALREGYELQDWDEYGWVCDQRAMNLYLHLPGNEHLGTVDYRRTLVQNIEASGDAEELERHREMLEQQAAGACASAVHFYGGNGRGYNAFAELYGLMPQALDDSGDFTEPEAPPIEQLVVAAAAVAAAINPPVPRIAHYVFGLRPDPEPFHIVHYLAIASCLEVVQPEEVQLHCHHRPTGPYWDLLEPRVVVHHVEPARAVVEQTYDDPVVARYAYAHHADFVRLDVLAQHGGLYADIDTLFVGRFSERLWRTSFVIGREADVPSADGLLRPALSNALLISKPGSAFVDAWRSEIAGALDGSWANHSCFLANDLALRLPNEVHVEPQHTFHAFEPTPAGIALLLEHSAPPLDGIAMIHLMAHLWWDEDRRDFSNVHAGMIDEQWVRTSSSTYATAARQFLPERSS